MGNTSNRGAGAYLYVWQDEDMAAGPSSVFFFAGSVSVAENLCDRLKEEHSDDEPPLHFHWNAAKSVRREDRIQLDRAIARIPVQDDPGGGNHGDPSMDFLIERAERVVRVQQLEEAFREYAEHGTYESMPAEDNRNSALNLLFMLAQTYNQLLWSSVSLASWASMLDVELNDSYFWTVGNLKNLLANHEELEDFPVEFEPILPDLNPTTVQDIDWEDMIAPDVQGFLSTVHQYVRAKHMYPPEEGSPAWGFLELFRGSIEQAHERADAYHAKVGKYVKDKFGESSIRQSPSQEQQAERSRSDPEKVVVLIHGIRTEANWTGMVRTTLERDPAVRVIPIGYGYFDVFRFLAPFGTRGAPVARVTRQIREVRSIHPSAHLYVIAHSFGTYTIVETLKNNPDLKLEGLILCGSVLPCMLEWERYAHQVASVILNEVGCRDVWPLLANSFTWGFGPSGSLGFRNAHSRDRYHDFGHSDFFSEEFVKDYWVPFISSNEVVGSTFEASMPQVAWWRSLLGTKPPRIVFTVALLMCAAWLGWSHMPPPLDLPERAALSVEDAGRLSRLQLGEGNIGVTAFVLTGDPTDYVAALYRTEDLQYEVRVIGVLAEGSYTQVEEFLIFEHDASRTVIASDDVDGDGDGEVYGFQTEGGTGGNSRRFCILDFRTRELRRFRLLHSWSHPTEITVESDPSIGSSHDAFVKRRIRQFRADLGVDSEGTSPYAEAAMEWEETNSRGFSKGRAKAQSYSVNEESDISRASISARIDVGDQSWISYFKSGVILYSRSRREFSIIWHPDSQYDWATHLQMCGEYLIMKSGTGSIGGYLVVYDLNLQTLWSYEAVGNDHPVDRAEGYELVGPDRIHGLHEGSSERFLLPRHLVEQLPQRR